MTPSRAERPSLPRDCAAMTPRQRWQSSSVDDPARLIVTPHPPAARVGYRPRGRFLDAPGKRRSPVGQHVLHHLALQVLLRAAEVAVGMIGKAFKCWA